MVCAYDLAGLRDGNDITCPECSARIDPYNPRAMGIRHVATWRAFAGASLWTLAPAAVAGFALVTFFGFAGAAVPLAYLPMRYCTRTIEAASQRRRRAVGLALGLGVLAGVATGVVPWLFVAGWL